MTPPNCFWSSGGFSLSRGSKKFLASRASFRPNTNSEPWNALVPDLLMRLT